MSAEGKLNKESYNRVAEDWHKEDAGEFTWWMKGADAFMGLLPHGAVVLDVGCGDGKKMKYLRDHGLEVTGIDISEAFVAIVKREQPEVPVYVADMHDLSEIPGVYDAIFAQASLLHIPKAEVPSVLAELAKKLKRGGYLHIAVKGIKSDGKEENIVSDNSFGYEYKRFFSFFTMDELKEQFARVDIECVWEYAEVVGRANWLQIIGRKREKPHRPFQLHEYDPAWRVRFEQVAEKLRPILRDNVVEIDHIGSTSIEGMVAKPQVDVLVVVKDLEFVKNCYDAFIRAGLTPRGRGYVNAEDEYVTEDGVGGTRLTSIHILQEGNPKIAEYKLFRDYLRTNSEDRELYIAAKRDLYTSHHDSYSKYDSGKKSLIDAIKARAQAWAEQK